jgi:tetratricopeptide (TPR) repeat protein
LKKYFDYYQLVRKARPDQDQALLVLGYLYSLEDQWDRAGMFFEEALAKNPGFMVTLFNAAVAAYRREDYARSATLLEKACALPFMDQAVTLLRSIIYRQLLSSDNAPRDIPVRLKGIYRQAHELLVRSLVADGRYAPMLQAALAAVQAFPEDADFFYYAGWAALAMGKPETGVGFLSRALALESRHEPTGRLLAAVKAAASTGSAAGLKAFLEELRGKVRSEQERLNTHARIL